MRGDVPVLGSFSTHEGWALCFLSVSEIIVRQSRVELTESLTLFSQGDSEGNSI